MSHSITPDREQNIYRVRQFYHRLYVIHKELIKNLDTYSYYDVVGTSGIIRLS